MRIALIDADSPVYAAGFAVQKSKWKLETDPTAVFNTKADALWYCSEYGLDPKCLYTEIEVEPVENALHIINTMLLKIVDSVKADKHEVYLSGVDNFRKDVATIVGYKANRVQPKPVHYDAIRQYIMNKWKGIVVDGQEADDEIGIRATEIQQAGDDSIIVSIDKDLLTIPSIHYNWKKEEWQTVDDEQAELNYYIQCLTGDRTDNIPGIDGVGPITAAKLLEGARDMDKAVRRAWKEAYPSGYIAEDGSVISTDNVVDEVKKLLWIRRSRNET